MWEECVVHDAKNGIAYVGLKHNSDCNGCNSCVFGKNKTNIVPAIENMECGVGDVVVVELPEKELNPVFALIYLLPILALFLGFFVGRLFSNEIIEAVFALVFCTLSIFLLYFLDKKFRKKGHMPVVVEIVKRNQSK